MNKCSVVLCGFFLSIFVLSPANLLYAQSAKDAYKALKKVDIQFQSGIDYKSFKAAYVDAKLEADMFYQSPGASKNKKLLEHLKRTSSAYEAINNIWGKIFEDHKIYIPRSPDNDKLARVQAVIEDECNNLLDIDYKYKLTPEELVLYGSSFNALNESSIEKISASSSSDVSTSRCPGYPVFTDVSRDGAIKVLMKEASKELELAYTALMKPGSQQTPQKKSSKNKKI